MGDGGHGGLGVETKDTRWPHVARRYTSSIVLLFFYVERYLWTTPVEAPSRILPACDADAPYMVPGLALQAKIWDVSVEMLSPPPDRQHVPLTYRNRPNTHHPTKNI
jgi:hypothetical protein